MSEKKRYLKLTFLYGSLTLFLLFLIFKFGISAAVWISELLQNKKPPQIADEEIIIPPPQLFPLPEATNSATLTISGYSLANQKVDIYLNNLNVVTYETDSEGKFEGNLSLALTNNEIYAITRDNQDRQSSPSKIWKIFYSNKSPDLKILEPEKGALIKKGTGVVEIKGQVHPTSKVSINDHFAIVESDGNFTYQIKLNPGENKIKIICVDPAQNKNEVEWILYYQP